MTEVSTRRARGAEKPRAARAADHDGTDLIQDPVEYEGLARTLVDVGRKAFAAHGFHNASVASIAEQAGTSVGLLYYHFGSKEGLHRAVSTDYHRRQWSRAHEAIKLVRSAGVTDGRRLFLAGTRAYLSNSWENRDNVRLIHVLDAPPSFLEETRSRTEEWVRMNARLLQLPDNLGSRVLVQVASAAIGGASRAVSECTTREEADKAVDHAMAAFSRLVGLPPDDSV